MAIQVGVVGTGFIGPIHVEALRRLGIYVKGVLGSSSSKSESSARQLGLEKGYRNYAEMLTDPDISVIHLTSPNKFHMQQVLDALKAGKHIICENLWP